MKSIRLFLISVLASCVMLLIFIALVNGYQRSTHEIERMFDKRLHTIVKLILPLASIYLKENKSGSHTDLIIKADIYIQVLNNKLGLIIKSDNMPESPLVEVTEGYHIVNYDNKRLKVLVQYQQEMSIWVIVAERDETRYKIADSISIAALTPIIIAVPFIAFIIWFVVGFGMKPIRLLSNDLRYKGMNDLKPIVLDNIPKELTSLALAANELLAKLSSSFEREKRLTSDITHELRTPLAATQIHLENLLNEVKGQRSLSVQESAVQLQQGVGRMSQLVEQILLFNRMAPDVYQSGFKAVNISFVVQQAITRLYPQIEEKNQTIEFIDNGGIIQGDEFGMKTLLDNLLTNAIKYTPNSGSIHISLQQTKRSCTLQVMDSGVGIDKPYRTKVFDRFYRVNQDSKAAKQGHTAGELGSGLGLSIVRRLITLHNATIKLSDSDFDSGLKVLIKFKIKP